MTEPERWQQPSWNNRQNGLEDGSFSEVAAILHTMTPEERAKLLQEFPASEVIAVAEMLQSLQYDN